MQRVAEAADRVDHHPRWQNEWNIVDIWLNTHEDGMKITDQDRELANTIDTLVKATTDAQVEAIVDKETTKITSRTTFEQRQQKHK